MEGTSLLDGSVTSMISGFAGDVVPTVLGLIAIVVPVGLSLWAIGFGIKKGLDYIQSKTSNTI